MGGPEGPLAPGTQLSAVCIRLTHQEPIQNPVRALRPNNRSPDGQPTAVSLSWTDWSRRHCVKRCECQLSLAPAAASVVRRPHCTERVHAARDTKSPYTRPPVATRWRTFVAIRRDCFCLAPDGTHYPVNMRVVERARSFGQLQLPECQSCASVDCSPYPRTAECFRKRARALVGERRPPTSRAAVRGERPLDRARIDSTTAELSLEHADLDLDLDRCSDGDEPASRYRR